MKFFLLITGLFTCIIATAQQVTPMPADVKYKDEFFKLENNTALSARGIGAEKSATFLMTYLDQYYHMKLHTIPRVIKNVEGPHISLLVDKSISSIPGYYELTVKDDKVEVTGNSDTALFYGVQSVIQLLSQPGKETVTIAGAKIKDYPRFAYRGMHLDVTRHFFPVSYVKKYIDYLALHKMNNFHWHLTDDQGWRIEIKKYPLLTSVGGCRAQTLSGRYGSDKYDGTKYCGYYTQDQIKDVVAYASERFINIIPEIEMPGHAMAAIAAYPQLSCYPDSTKKAAETWGVFEDIICPTEYSFGFMQGVIDEVIALFPSKYIHIGGDEAPKESWKKSAYAQQLIKKENLKDEHGLQSYFIQRMEKYINSKGRNIIGWDEILEGGLAPNASVMSWRGEKGGIEAAKLGHYVVMSPESPLYFDHAQTRNEDSLTRGNFNALEKVYVYNPLPSSLTAAEQKYILGAQANVWTEYMDNGKKVDYMIFPRMSALSEALWTPLNKKDWNDFVKRLPGIMNRYNLWKTSYSTAFFDLQPSVVPDEKEGITWQLETRAPGAKILYTSEATKEDKMNYIRAIPITTTGMYGATTIDATKKEGKWTYQLFELNKASGKKISLVTEPNASYSGSGAFTLVDGIQNKTGMVKSSQFLGFVGKDLEAVIDLGSRTRVNAISLHAFEQQGSWIYAPAAVHFYVSDNGKDFSPVKDMVIRTGSKNIIYKAGGNYTARYIKVLAKNYGLIPTGMPGAGNKSWLFADEIVVE